MVYLKNSKLYVNSSLVCEIKKPLISHITMDITIETFSILKMRFLLLASDRDRSLRVEDNIAESMCWILINTK